jgi:hypothetical protein
MTEGNSRHGCLTAWLVLMIIANSATAVVYILGSDTVSQALPDMPGWVFPVLIVFSLFNLVCAVALFQWKKWGFWGFCITSIVALVVNLSSGLGIGSSLTGLIGLAVLFGVLQIGDENKGWPQLD